jgi:Grx4 family monothiol glutaredoxin
MEFDWILILISEKNAQPETTTSHKIISPLSTAAAALYEYTNQPAYSTMSAAISELAAPPPTGIKTVLLFWAPWHEDSVSLKESVLPALASSSSALAFGCVEAEAQPTLSEQYNVTVVPTFVFLGTDGTVSERMEGTVEIAAVTQAVQRLGNSIAGGAPAVSKSPKTEEEPLNDRLARLVQSSDVMLFLKGTPTDPQCGFSRQAVAMLEESQIRFGSFDILSDDVVRQGLKEYSDWPTYPQLYAKGELIGGLDIMKEMMEDDSMSLADQLGVKRELTLDERLAELLQRHRIMVFMKGVPSAPRCGFSRQIVEMMEEQGVEYDAFNILEDEEVRQGLKKYSDWPTYPQLYVDGDLIGGLDIVKEMQESGDLADLVK